IAEVCVQRLQMQRIWVVNGAANFSRSQMLLKGITPLAADGVLVVNVFATFRLVRRHDSRNLLQQARVLGGMGTPRALPLPKMAELDAQNGGLNLIQPAVPAWFAA